MTKQFQAVVTGFAPFNNDPSNPSWQAVKLLPQHLAAEKLSIQVHLEELPVSYVQAAARSQQLVETLTPDILIHVGYHAKAPGIMLESRAYNLMDATIADNDGMLCTAQPIELDGPEFVAARWDAEELTQQLAAQGFPVHVSHDAGRYVCNSTLYTAVKAQKPGRLAGFVHVPGPERVTTDTVTTTLQALLIAAAQQLG